MFIRRILMTDLNPKALKVAGHAARPHIGDGRLVSREEAEEVADIIVTAYLEAAGDGWQPIESAPKDTPVLFSIDGGVIQGCVRGDEDGVRYDVAWLFGWPPSRSYPDPTHWMPLPAPSKGGA
jgi:hypothetical protein